MQKQQLIETYRRGLQLYQQGDPRAGLAALATLPPVAEIPFYRGLMQLDLGDFNAASSSFEQFIQHNRDAATTPNIQTALLQLGRLKSNLGDIEAGLHYIEELLSGDSPPSLAYLHWIALAPLIYSWHNRDTITATLPSLNFSPAMAGDLDLSLLNLHYLALDRATTAQLHQLWGGLRSVEQLPNPTARSPKTQAKLRIGYLSPDFRSHSVGYFLQTILQHHSDEIEIQLYSLRHFDDPLTRWFQSNFNYVDLSHENPASAAERIHGDELDLLVECAGHTAGNGLEICRYKPAPAILTAWGYPNTSGLPQIDYRLSDMRVDAPDAQEYYSETLLRMPSKAFLPMINFERPAASSFKEELERELNIEGRCLIGSFNALAKLNPEVIATWNSILRENPNAQLLISSTNLHLDGVRQRLLKELAAGIDPARITILPREADPLRHRQRIMACDFCLDPWPYNGTTTTCEILAMGVPVLTLQGESHVQRTSATLLHSLRLASCVSESRDAYRAIAGELIANGSASLKEQLEEQLTTIDNAAWVAELEELYRTIT